MPKSEALQKQTQRILAEMGTPGKPLSARAAGEKLEIGYNQIADMVKGKAPAEKTLIKFASAIGESPADWLRYAGKHDFAETLGTTEDAESSPNEQRVQQMAQQIARELARAPGEHHALLLRQIRALIRASSPGGDH